MPENSLVALKVGLLESGEPLAALRSLLVARARQVLVSMAAISSAIRHGGLRLTRVKVATIRR